MAAGAAHSGRFAYLMQPIRDQSANWAINIAAILEQYITEMHAAPAVDADGQPTRFDFAEAALLIQGTACIFGRKVEYLHQLVVEALELFTHKRHKPKDAAGKPKRNREERSDHRLAADSFREATVRRTGRSRESAPTQAAQDFVLGDADRLTFFIVPMCLTPLEESERSALSLFSRSGDAIGKKDDFKLNGSAVDVCGALLLDVENEQWLLEALQLGRCPYDEAEGAPDAAQDYSLNDGPMDCDDSFGGGDGDDAPMGDDLPMGDAPPPAIDDDAATEMGRDAGADALTSLDAFGGSAAPRGSVTLLRVGERQARDVGPRALVVDRVPACPIGADPWLRIDPFAVSKGPARPRKSGKPFKTPADILKACARRKRKLDDLAPATLEVEPQWVSDFAEERFYSYRHRVPKTVLKTLTWPSTEEQYLIEQKRRQGVRKNVWPRLADAGDDDDEEEAEDDAYDNYEGADDVADDRSDVGGTPLLADADFDCPSAPPDASAPLCGGGGGGEGETQRPMSRISYEQMVEQFVQQCAAQCQAYACTSALDRRVQQWEERILPRLKQEEARRPFEIHAYGAELLGQFAGVGDEQPFGALVSQFATWEIGRYFLSSLMLANAYNVQVSATTAPLDHCVNTMRLKLLSIERRHDVFSDANGM